MSLLEMENRFDSEWVVIEDPVLDASLNVVRGRVRWHGKNRDEVYQKAMEMHVRRPAVLRLGAPPKDAVIAV
jgi:hypothetical protein